MISLVALHLLPTGYRPISDPVSNYAVSHYDFLYTSQTICSAVCGICLINLFLNSPVRVPIPAIAALGVYSASRLVIFAFPTDIKPPRTARGTVHVILAILTFAGIAVAAGIATPVLVNDVTWSAVGTELRWSAYLIHGAVILFPVVFAFRPLKQISGLVERLIYLGTLSWFGFLLAGALVS